MLVGNIRRTEWIRYNIGQYFIKHYETLIEAGGTAGGKRANKFVEYVGENRVYVIKLLRLYHLAQK